MNSSESDEKDNFKTRKIKGKKDIDGSDCCKEIHLDSSQKHLKNMKKGKY